MNNFVDEYLSYIKNYLNKSHKTVASYKIDLKQFIDYFSQCDMKISDIKKDDLLDFLNFLYTKKNVQQRSVARKISCIKSFCKFLISSEKFSENELKAILFLRSPKFKPKLPKVIDSKKIFQVIDYIKSNECKIYKYSWERCRDIALIILLYTSGMRIFEALSLKKSDISDENYTKITGKGNKERIVPIIDIAKKFIILYLNERPFDLDFLFTNNKNKQYSARNFQKNLQNIRMNLNFPDFLTPHCLRHSCATDLLSNDAQIRQIQELLGHSSLSTTQIYTHVGIENIASKYNEIMNK